jgi:ankyrin repeat protein
VTDDLVIHCAVMANPGKRSLELVQYLLEAYPDALEKRTTSGDTPLMIACRLGRLHFAEQLIQANADQSTRNAKGENVLHAALAGLPSAHKLRPLLELLDKDLRSHLFQQRNSLQENGLTPLHAWISSGDERGGANQSYYNHYNYNYNGNTGPWYRDATTPVEVLKLLLEFSQGSELHLLSGVGETPLHTTIVREQPAVVKVLIDFQPRLLCRENAVGRTPAEVAQDLASAKNLQKPSEPPTYFRTNRAEDLVKDAPQSFVKIDADSSAQEDSQLAEKLGLSNEYTGAELRKISCALGLEKSETPPSLSSREKKDVIWDLCQTAMNNSPEPRRLVSLNEANDVAKRLGETFTDSRYFSMKPRADEDEDEENKEENDVNDFASRTFDSRLNSAWKAFDEPEEARATRMRKCGGCGQYHA